MSRKREIVMTDLGIFNCRNYSTFLEGVYSQIQNIVKYFEHKDKTFYKVQVVQKD
jgi:hypothetical protein